MRRVQKKGAHAEYPFDKYALYTEAVQSPDTDVEFVRDTYKELKKKLPVTFREDFCGTFITCCEWVKLNKNFKAIGVDLDPEPLSYGRERYLPKLKPDQIKRVTLLEGDVLSPKLPKADVVMAANFSYFVFKTRDRMKQYFKNVLGGLNKDGLFIIDCFGGSLCYDANEESTKNRKFTYYWEQEDFDPVANRAQFYIHFRLKNGKKYERVFSYDWRLWSIPELRDILEEVGFSKVHIYWEGTKRDGTGDGNFKNAVVGEACDSWVAYLVAEA